MQIIIDLDGTICDEEKTFSRSLAQPIPGAVECINTLYERGNIIIIFSARSWMEFEMTTAWLKNNSVKYHQLILGKPIGDVWIDDRAIQFDNWKNVFDVLDKKSK